MGSIFKGIFKKMVKRKLIKDADNIEHKLLLPIIVSSVISFFILIIVIIVVVYGPIFKGVEYLRIAADKGADFFDKLSNFFSIGEWCSTDDGDCQKIAEQKYYEELDDVYQKYQKKGVEIDDQLITGTIFYGYQRANILSDDEIDENGLNKTFINTYCYVNEREYDGCFEDSMNDYDKIYDRYFDAYVKIKENYDKLSLSSCSDMDYVKDVLVDHNTHNFKDEDYCRLYLWNYADLSDADDVDDLEIDAIIYDRGKDDIDLLAKQMIVSSSINYNHYRDYLIREYIPAHYSALYAGYEDRDYRIEKIADEIMMFASKGYNGNNYAGGSYGSCSYNVSGNQVNATDVDVVLLSCDGSMELERVDFEKYIKGVVYGEIGSSWSDEVLKSQAVAARSYTLTRNQTLCPGRPQDCEYGYNPKKNEIRMRNCEADQVYCDYSQGCQNYNYNGYNSIITGLNNPSFPEYKPKLTNEQIEAFEEALNSVQGIVLIDENDNIYASSFTSVDQNAWNAASSANPSLDYNEILIKHYWGRYGINLTASNNCTYFGVTGEFSTWKQFDPRWDSIPLGIYGSTIHQIGCLVTSISIQLARSGTVNLPQFDPGVFAQELKKNGSFSDGGGLLWAPLNKTINQLTDGNIKPQQDIFLSGTKENKIKTIQQYVSSNNLLVIGLNSSDTTKVGSEGHWVAVDRVESNEVYIFDPGNSYFNTVSAYDWKGVTTLHVYSVVR